MKIALEVTGGFTGKAGKQVIQVDTDQLDPAAAAQLNGDLEQLPDQTWGQFFEAPHPKPWDFIYQLTLGDDGQAKSVRFHLNQGPPGLTRIAEQLKELHNTRDSDTSS
jgi:hypothetical protein